MSSIPQKTPGPQQKTTSKTSSTETKETRFHPSTTTTQARAKRKPGGNPSIKHTSIKNRTTSIEDSNQTPKTPK